MTRLKAFVTNPVDRPPAETSLRFVALEHIEPGTGRLLPSVEPEDVIDETAVLHRAGDVRFGKLRPYLAKSLRMTEDGQGSGELLVLRPRPGLDPGFLHHLTLSEPFVGWATATAYGVKMPRTNFEALGALQVDVPPIVEQRRIADYLDAETARTDELIAEQEALIGILGERRTAELDGWIEHGGGVSHLWSVESPWLDAVPDGWSLMPLKHAVQRVMVGIVITPSAFYEDSGVPVLRGLNVRPGRVSADDLVYTSEHSNLLHAKSILREGDVVVVRTGLAGAAARVPEWAVGGNAVDLLIVRPGQQLLPAYLEMLLNSRLVQRQVVHGSVGALQAHFNTSSLSNVAVTVPPIDEQHRIIDHLTDALGRYDELIGEAECQIALLRERRQALITHAVTHGIEGLPGVA